jgi:probable HAF family extracellular repeat protein
MSIGLGLNRLPMAIAAMSAMATSIPAYAATFYSIKSLGAVNAVGLNNFGQVAYNYQNQAFLWSATGGAVNIGSLGGSSIYAAGLNDHGQVVGSAQTAGGDSRGFVYTSGSMAAVGTLGGNVSAVQAINNAGNFVGSATDIAGKDLPFIGNSGGLYPITVFANAGGTFPTRGIAFGINESNTVVGANSPNFGGFESGFTYQPNGSDLSTGTVTYITPGFSRNRIYTTGINEAGAVIGFQTCDGACLDENGHPTTFLGQSAFVTANGVPKNLPTFGGKYSIASGINDAGKIVGWTTYSNNYNVAALYENEVPIDLNSLIDPGLGWTLREAQSINNAGQILASGYYLGEYQTVLLTPSASLKVPPIIPPAHKDVRVEGLSAFDPSKPTLIITHGWQPTGSDTGWMDDMETAMDAALPSTGANILRVYWDDAKTNNLTNAYVGTNQVGRQLAELLQPALSQSDQSIQFIGHSLGTHVNAWAVRSLTDSGLEIDQFTILDRPLGYANYAANILNPPMGDFDLVTFQATLRKDKVIWVDNYFGDDRTLPFPSTGSSFDGKAIAFNREYNDANHINVHEEYAHSIINGATCSSQGGFGCSVLMDGLGKNSTNKHWDPLTSNSPIATAILINSGSWNTSNCSMALGSAFCSEGSPAYLWNESFHVSDDDRYLSFEIDWLNVGDGDWLSVFFEESLLFSFRGNTTTINKVIDSGFIPISQFAGRDGQLLFALNSVGEKNAALNIGQLRRYGLNATAVPEPSTFIILICGFAVCGYKLRRKSILSTTDLQCHIAGQ